MYGRIGDTVGANGELVKGISGSEFAYEMQQLEKTCNKINVHINSIGGSVLEGYSIISAILDSKVPVETHIDGLAASIAGVIAVAGDCYPKQHASWMGHDAQGGDNDKMRAMVTDTLVTILTANTKKSPEEIKAMLSKETWISNSKENADFTLEQGVEMGFFKAIKPSTNKVKIKKTESLTNMAQIYNSLLIEKKPMNKITNEFGLTNEASEDSVVTEIKKLKASNATLEAKVKEYETKEATEKEAKKVELTNKANILVDGAINAGKIKAEEKDSYVTSAIANFSFVENVLSKISNVKEATKVFDFKNVGEGKEDRSQWDHKKWCEKDPAGLLELQNSSPEAFKLIIDKLPKQLSNEYKGL